MRITYSSGPPVKIPPGQYLMTCPGVRLPPLRVGVLVDGWGMLSVKVPSGNLHPIETFPDGTVFEIVDGRGGEVRP